MPTVLEDGPYSFIFFSSDKGEPPHIHVKRERRIAKFWLDPVEATKPCLAVMLLSCTIGGVA